MNDRSGHLPTAARPRTTRRGIVLAVVTATAFSLLPPISVTAITRTLDFETKPDGSAIADGTIIRNEFEASHGVSFPDGVVVQVCGSGRPCPTAHSGSRVATGRLRDEFSNRPVEMTFTAAKNSVGFHVAAFNTASAGVQATAFDASGGVVDTASIGSVSRTSWTQLSLVDASGADITRVLVTGGTPGTTDNLFAIDRLVSDGPDTPPSGGGDTSAPTVDILNPPDGATVSRETFSAFVEVQEEDGGSGLAYIDLEVTHVDSGTTIIAASGGNVCGATTSCPESTYSDFPVVSLDPDRAGTYRYAFTGCDRAGNCATAAQTVVYEPGDEPADVRVMALEVNQGVQARIFDDVTGPGTFQSYFSTVPLVPNKLTVVRVYLGADEPVAGATAQLTVRAIDDDGSVDERTFRPNAGATTVDAPVESSDSVRQLLEMRADLARTLNFVIPASHLATADAMQLIVRDGPLPISGTVEVELGRFNELSLNFIRVIGETTGVPVRRSRVESDLLPYLRAAFPISYSTVISERVFGWSGAYAFADDCDSLLFDVWWAYGGYDAPVRPRRDHPVWVPTAAIVDEIDGCGGIAYLGDPTDDDDRIGETLVSEPFGDILAHEIGHTMGLVHASNAHGEADGGDHEPWPYPHGVIGPDSTTTVFGVHAALRSDYTYDVALVDACPTTDVSRRLPMCTVADSERAHELMSYGGGSGTINDLVTWAIGWPSDITYSRVYRAIVDGVAASAVRASQTGESQVTGLLVQGLIDERGVGHLVPVMRKSVPASAVDDDGDGSLTVELRAADGSVIAARHVSPTAGHEDDVRVFRTLLPDSSDATSVAVTDGVTDLAVLQASETPPVITIDGPLTGSVVAKPTNVSWSVRDPDGNEAAALLQVSFDGGLTWEGVATARAGDTTATIDLSGFHEAGPVDVRVTVSDGFHTASAQRRFEFTPPPPTPRDIGAACPAPVPDAGFSDVDDRSVHARAIDCIAWWQITSGVAAGRYAPAASVSRGQMASFIARLIESSGGVLPQDAPDRFDDDEDSVHEPAINALAELGVLRGTAPRRSAPNAAVSRAQMGTFLVQGLIARTGVELPDDVADRFTDDDTSVHELRINQAAASGLASGTRSQRFGPSVPMRRDQMASFLARLLDLLTVEGHAHPPTG